MKNGKQYEGKFFYLTGPSRIVYVRQTGGENMIISGLAISMHDAHRGVLGQVVTVADFERMQPKPMVFEELKNYTFMRKSPLGYYIIKAYKGAWHESRLYLSCAKQTGEFNTLTLNP